MDTPFGESTAEGGIEGDVASGEQIETRVEVCRALQG